MTERRFVFGVDLDGVVADFYKALRPLAAEWQGLPIENLPDEVSYGLPEWGFRDSGEYKRLHRFAVTQRQLFLNLPPIDKAPVILRRLSDADVHIRIITHRLFVNFIHPEAASQTIDWLERYGIPYRDLCFMDEKTAVGADLYIEDAPKNVQALRDLGLPTIVFSNSTNRTLKGPRADTWEQVERLVLEAQQLWKDGAWPQKEWRED